MGRDKSTRMAPRNASMTAALVLLVLVCLAECATEQRINSRGSKSNNIEKVNAWRSQRGGSCLNYGHSCWGAHGKRSAAAPDWFLHKLLRRGAANENNNMIHFQRSTDDDSSATYRGDADNDSPTVNRLSDNEDYSLELQAPRKREAKPMLDDDLLAKIKMWNIMRDAYLE